MTVSAATTVGQVLTSAYVNNNINSGLTYITEATIGNGVSTVTVAGCFSTTYDNYQIVLAGSDSSSLNNIVTMQLNNSTGATYNTSSFYIIHGGATGSNTATASGVFRFAWGGDVSDTSANVTVYSPFLTKRTAISGQTTNASLTAFNGGVDTNAVSNTGFTLGVGADTLTGGTITVYGYRKA